MDNDLTKSKDHPQDDTLKTNHSITDSTYDNDREVQRLQAMIDNRYKNGVGKKPSKSLSDTSINDLIIDHMAASKKIDKYVVEIRKKQSKKRNG